MSAYIAASEKYIPWRNTKEQNKQDAYNSSNGDRIEPYIDMICSKSAQNVLRWKCTLNLYSVKQTLHVVLINKRSKDINLQNATLKQVDNEEKNVASLQSRMKSKTNVRKW